MGWARRTTITRPVSRRRTITATLRQSRSVTSTMVIPVRPIVLEARETTLTTSRPRLVLLGQRQMDHRRPAPQAQRCWSGKRRARDLYRRPVGLALDGIADQDQRRHQDLRYHGADLLCELRWLQIPSPIPRNHVLVERALSYNRYPC